MAKKHGFTVIELLSITVLLAVIGAVFWIQFNNVKVAERDDKRRTAINAMYYGLEKVYAPQNKQTYPRTLDEKTLPGVDPELFTDPGGYKIGDSNSTYRYTPADCKQNSCASYTLRADLEVEADYVKKSPEAKK